MKILVLSDLWVPFPGGAERLMFNVARDLERRGADVDVVTGYHPAKRFDGPTFEVWEVPENEVGARALTQAIADYAPDVILTHHYWALTFETAITAPGIPIVQLVLNGRRMGAASIAVFISEAVRARKGMGQLRSDLTIHPPAYADDVAADRHGDAIGFIKPLHHKGVDLFYEIAAAMPDRRFVVLRGEWQDIETIRPFPHVEFMEPVDDIRDFYEKVRLVLVPSLSEDAGTVGQECAVNRIPCVSSAVGGLPETNRGGFLVSAARPDAWVEAIEGLDDPAEYEYIVDRQARQTPTEQREKFDELADRIQHLAR